MTITHSTKAQPPKRRHREKGAGRAKSSGRRPKAKAPQPEDQAKPIDSATREQLIGDLAKVDDPIAYEAKRIEAAKQLGVRRLSVIDRAVSKKRRALGLDVDDDEGQGRAVKIDDPLPWYEPVSGDLIATTLACVVKTYLVLPDAAADAIALWILHTWLVDKFTMSPRLAITSATKGCGKTTLLRLLVHVTRRGKKTGSISPSALFRAVEKFHPTIMLDETEKYVEHGSDLHALLNEGHCKGASTWRVLGEKMELREFGVFGAVAFARNGRIPEDLEQRSINIEMQRRLAGEPLTRLRDGPSDQLHKVARMCARWAEDHAEEVGGASVDTDTGDAINRIGDNWLPLFAIADVIGDDWPARIREAAASLTSHESDSLGTTLLADIKMIFDEKQTDRVSSADVCEALAAIEGRPWADWKVGKAMTPNQLARMLKPFHVVTNLTVRVGIKTAKGYSRHQFEDVWIRYLTPTGANERSQGNNATATGTSTPFQKVTADVDVTFQNDEKSLGDSACYLVTDEKGGSPLNGEVALSAPSQVTDEDRSCRQCGGTLDGTETAYLIRGERTWLHPECKPHYLKEHPASPQRATDHFIDRSKP